MEPGTQGMAKGVRNEGLLGAFFSDNWPGSRDAAVAYMYGGGFSWHGEQKVSSSYDKAAGVVHTRWQGWAGFVENKVLIDVQVTTGGFLSFTLSNLDGTPIQRGTFPLRLYNEETPYGLTIIVFPTT